MAQSDKSIYDLISVVEDDDGNAILDDIKPVTEIYQELVGSGVTINLSFHAGIKLSNILNRIQQVMLTEVGTEEDEVNLIDSALTDEELNFLYGIYLIR